MVGIRLIASFPVVGFIGVLLSVNSQGTAQSPDFVHGKRTTLATLDELWIHATEFLHVNIYFIQYLD